MKRAGITAFLCLAFVLFVSFALGILEISIIHTSKNMSRLSVDRALFSVFGEYSDALMDNYHIFSIEGSYGTGDMDEDHIIRRMQYYGAGDMKQKITGIQYLTDQGGQAFREQVIRYMEEKYGISLIREFTGLIPQWEEQNIQAEEMEKKEKGILDGVDELMEDAQTPQTEETEMPEELEGTENLTDGGPFTCIEKIEKTGLLSVVLPADMDLSGRKIDPDMQVSNRSLNTGRGVFPVRQGTGGPEERLLFNEYILSTFSDAASGQEQGEEKSTSDNPEEARSLEYETEYILEGKSSDKENLESFLMKLFLVRMVLNYVYLTGDQTKQAEVSALAIAVTTVLLIPEAAEVLKQLILLAWAAGESVVDIRALLSGKRAALVKNSDTWQVSLSSLLTLGSGTEQIEGEDVPGGISYKDYLRIFLFLESPEDLNMRSLDRIEENMKAEYGMEYFRADQCITKMETENTAEILGGVTYTFPAYFGYK